MFKVVKKRDFVRARTDFEKNFVITNNGVPEGLYLTVSGLKSMSEEELSDFLFEVLNYLGIVGHGEEK
jgi:hypothetical protein